MKRKLWIMLASVILMMIVCSGAYAMQINVNIVQDTLVLEVSPEDTVLSVKQQIQQQ